MDDSLDNTEKDKPYVYVPPTFHKNAEGKYHNEDGPAIIWCNGSAEWYINGKKHREDGPALIYKHKDSILERRASFNK